MFIELNGAYVVPDELVTQTVGIRYKTEQYNEENGELYAHRIAVLSCANVRFSQG